MSANYERGLSEGPKAHLSSRTLKSGKGSSSHTSLFGDFTCSVPVYHTAFRRAFSTFLQGFPSYQFSARPSKFDDASLDAIPESIKYHLVMVVMSD